MPFLSSFGGATSIGFGFSHSTAESGGGPYLGTLYYYEGADETDTTSTWATLAKWYKNSNHATQATELPTLSNATVLLNNTSADAEAWTAPASINLTTKTLTLNAHQYVEDPSCDPAIQFDTQVTGAEGSSLVLNGHMEVVGVNHSESYFNQNTNTTYYFEPEIAVSNNVEGYIYESQYANTVAAVALAFVVLKEDVYYNVTTNNAGKVTAVTIVPSTYPNTDTDIDNFQGRLSFDPRFIGYTYTNSTLSCDYAGGNPTIKLMVPSDLTKKPVYVVSVFTPGEGEGWSDYNPLPYDSTFVLSRMSQGSPLYREYNCDAEGYTGTGYTDC